MDKYISYKNLRELFSLSPRFKEHFYKILYDKEFMNDMKADYIKLVNVCFSAFEAALIQSNIVFSAIRFILQSPRCRKRSLS